VTHLRKSKTGQGEIAKGGGLSEYLLGKNVKDTKGNRIIWNQFKMSGNMMNILFRSDSKKVSGVISKQHIHVESLFFLY